MSATRRSRQPPLDVPDHVQTPAKIISEAKSSLQRLQPKPLTTGRPDTPRQNERELFGKQSGRLNRPPSAFRYVALLKFTTIKATGHQ